MSGSLCEKGHKNTHSTLATNTELEEATVCCMLKYEQEHSADSMCSENMLILGDEGKSK